MKNKYLKIYYTFLDWKDETTKEKFHNSVSFWGQEILTSRQLPKYPKGIMLIDDKEDKNGTITNSTITIHYLPSYEATPKTIEKFMLESGILVKIIN